MPRLEAEIAHLKIRKRRRLRLPQPRTLDLHFHDTQGRLRLWSRSRAVVPWSCFDVACELYVLLDRGVPVGVRAHLEGDWVSCTYMGPGGATLAMSKKEFAALCLGVVKAQASRREIAGR
jgi:hypothetical protein